MSEQTRRTLVEIEAAARVLHEIGRRHGWWRPYAKTYEELAATDSVGKSEFDGIVERMLIAATDARLQLPHPPTSS